MLKYNINTFKMTNIIPYIVHNSHIIPDTTDHDVMYQR
jgi:hypothetical protein